MASLYSPRIVATVIGEIAKNVAMTIPMVRKIRAAAGRTALPPSFELLQRYAYDQLDNILAATGSISGKSVLEIGPGDNLISGLAFLAAGAASYTALDRFPGAYDNETAKEWYHLLKKDWLRKYPHFAWPADLDPLMIASDHRVTIIRQGVEDAGDLSYYDLVCSHAVGEHVSDVQAFAVLTARALKPGGIALHTIDLSSHNWGGFDDPFLFLKFPKPLWRAMGSMRGIPNRVRFDGWVQAFERAGLEVDVLSRTIVDFDPTDEWVKRRVSDNFLTHSVVFKSRKRSHELNR